MVAMSSATEAALLERGAGVRLLEDAVVLAVTGDDARTWLNGQVTNDVRATKRGDAVYALVIHVRGKILADTWVLDRGDELALVLPATALATVRAELEKYIIMEDVTLVDRSDLAVITVQGPRAREVIAQAPLIARGLAPRRDAFDRPRDTPEAGVEGPASSATGTPYPCDRLGLGGFDVLAPRAHADEVKRALADAAERVGGGEVTDAGWELVRLRRAVPRFGQIGRAAW